MSKPLFTLYRNERLTPELWAAFLRRAAAARVPPGVLLYELILAYVATPNEGAGDVANDRRRGRRRKETPAP